MDSGFPFSLPPHLPWQKRYGLPWESPQRFTTDGSRSNLLYIGIAALGVIAVVLGYMVYQDRQNSGGVEIKIGEGGVSIEKNQAGASPTASDTIPYANRATGIDAARHPVGQDKRELDRGTGNHTEIVLLIFLLGGFSGRFGGYGYGYGHGGIGAIGSVLIILVVLVVMGRV